MTFFSIIINCYNGAEFITQAIESVLCQGFKDFEIIIWDNKSTDDSIKISEGFNDSRIKIYKSSSHTNLGTARANAIKKASGDWISFLDVDDWYEPTRLELIHNKIVSLDQNYSMIFSQAYTYFEDLEKKKIRPRKPLYTDIGAHKVISLFNLIPFCSAVYKSSEILFIIEKTHGFIHSPDYLINYLLSKSGKVYFIPVPLATYRIHPKSLTSKNKKDGYIESIKIMELFSNNLIDEVCHRIKFSFFLLSSGEYQSARKNLKNITFRQLFLGFFNLLKVFIQTKFM